MMYCNHCGHPLNAGRRPKFCPSCGGVLESVPPFAPSNQAFEAESRRVLAEVGIFANRYKWWLIGAAGALVLLLVLYFLLRATPEADGKKLAEMRCDCSTKYLQNQAKKYEAFLSGFDGKGFKNISEGQITFTGLNNQPDIQFANCNKSYTQMEGELAERWNQNSKKYARFLQSSQSSNACNTNDLEKRIEVLNSEIVSKINDLPPDYYQANMTSTGYVVYGAIVNVRQYPKVESAIVGQIHRGDMLYPDRYSSDDRGVTWYHFSQNNINGWASSLFMTDQNTWNNPPTAYVRSSRAYFHQFAGETFNVMQDNFVITNDIVKIYSRYNGYIYSEYNNVRGWLLESDLY